MTTLLIDGDQYLYRCCAATERDVKFDDENHVLMSNEEEAWDTLQASISDILNRFGTKNADAVVVCGTGPYFRHTLYPAYKPGRARKPLCYTDVKDRLKAEYKVVEYEGLEADDVMGILATKPGNDAIIVARDKDMKGVGPAKIWDGKDFHNIREAEADYYHLYQTLTGDSTDGYKGCPGIGPVKAQQILSQDLLTTDTRDLWRLVVKAYEKAGLTEDDALLQARLARILRWEDWDSKKKEPILWTP